MAKRTIKCEIINIEEDPIHDNRTIVSVRLQQGRKKWIQAFSMLNPERPISQEEFMEHLKTQTLQPPVDGFAYLKKATNQPFEIEVGTPQIGEINTS